MADVAGAPRPLGWKHQAALAMLAVHAFFLMITLVVVEISKTLDAAARGHVELAITAMLGTGMVLFFLYSKWISPAKGNALIQVVNVALGTALFTAFFPEQNLEILQWIGIAACSVGIAMMVRTGETGFFLHPDSAGAEAGVSPGASLRWLIIGVALGVALWSASMDWSGFDGGFASFQAVLAKPENALSLFVFEVSATTIVPLVAKVAVSQRALVRIVVSAGSLALLGLSLYFFFYYSDTISVPKSNAILQTVNTLVGTMLVAWLFPDERLNLRQWAGVALCCAGIALTLQLYDGQLDFYR